MVPEGICLNSLNFLNFLNFINYLLSSSLRARISIPLVAGSLMTVTSGMPLTSAGFGSM